MFTGLVEEIGTVRESALTERGLRLRIDAQKVVGDLDVGASIAVDGVCQTVVERDANGFTVEAMAPTLARTNLRSLKRGARVNLERPLKMGDRLDGHLVQGHVDAVGRVERVQRNGEYVLVDASVPSDIAELTVLHGSITINGVSLTVNALPADNVVQIALIPHTWENTNLHELQPGSEVNLEADMFAKLTAHYLERHYAVRPR